MLSSCQAYTCFLTTEAKNRKKMPYFQTNQFVTTLSLISHGGGELEYSKCLLNKGHYRSEDLLSEKFLGVLSHGGNKNLAGLANFDFRIYDVT